MLKGFKDFIMRGNVVDLAVGVVIGSSFGAVVNSLVKDLITPLIAAVVKTPDFSSLHFTIHSAQFMYGNFLNTLITFLIVAGVVYFFVVTPINTLMSKVNKKEEPPPPNTKICPECLSEIPLAAKRCAHCTVVLPQQ